MEADPPFVEQAAEVAELDVDDVLHLGATEAVEEDDLVEPVEELRAEGLAHHLHDGCARVLGDGAFGEVGEVLGAQVRGEDDEGVAKIDGPPLPVGEPAVVEHLEEDVEHVGGAPFRPRRRG